MVNFNPYEERRLEGLLPAMKHGLDPAMAYEIFSGVEGGALNRMAENRAMRQQMFADASSELRSAAAGGLPQGGAMDLVESYQAETPGLARGKYQGRLEDLAGGLYEGPGKFSDLFVPEAGGAEGEAPLGAQAALTPEDVQGIYGDAMTAATNPDGPLSLHETRMVIMSKLRAMGYSEPSLDEAYNVIGSAYTAAGVDPGSAPIDVAQRLAQMRAERRLSGVSGSLNVGIE